MESIRALDWIVRDKRLDVVSGRRTSVDKGRHGSGHPLVVRGRSITDVYVVREPRIAANIAKLPELLLSGTTDGLKTATRTRVYA